MRVLEGQDHGRLVGLVVVRFYCQLTRARGRDLVLYYIFFLRAREAREAPGGGRRECERCDEAARRHRCSYGGGFAFGFYERGCGGQLS